MIVSQPCRPFPAAPLLLLAFTVVIAVHFSSQYATDGARSIFGDVPPIAAAGIAGVIGVMALWLLQRRYSLCVLGPVRFSDYRRAALLALPFMAVVTIADAVWRFSEDLNIALPTAFIFYLAIAVVAQLLLHIAPLALIFSVLSVLLRGVSPNIDLWASMILAALIEAVFQVTMISQGGKSARSVHGRSSIRVRPHGVLSVPSF